MEVPWASISMNLPDVSLKPCYLLPAAWDLFQKSNGHCWKFSYSSSPLNLRDTVCLDSDLKKLKNCGLQWWCFWEIQMWLCLLNRYSYKKLLITFVFPELRLGERYRSATLTVAGHAWNGVGSTPAFSAFWVQPVSSNLHVSVC